MRKIIVIVFILLSLVSYSQSNNIVLKGTNTRIDRIDKTRYITYINNKPYISTVISKAFYYIWTSELSKKREFVFTNDVQGDMASCYYVKDRKTYMLIIGKETFYFEKFIDVRKEVELFFEERTRNKYLFTDYYKLVDNNDKYKQKYNIILKGTNTWIDKGDDVYITYINGKNPNISIDIKEALDDIWTTELAQKREFTFTDRGWGDILTCKYDDNRQAYVLLGSEGEIVEENGVPVIETNYENIKGHVTEFFADGIRSKLYLNGLQ